MIEKPRVVKSESQLSSDLEKVDLLPSALRELFFIENPTLQKTDADANYACEQYVKSASLESVWVVYPWRYLALHVPNEETYFKLLTARNRNLISTAEQNEYHRFTVGVAGLSVGSAACMALVATGGPQHIKIADPDTVEITNLNRMCATLADVGSNKTEVAAKNAWEINPFLDLELWSEGIREDTLRVFMSEPRLDVFIDEMDAIEIKIASRRLCQELRIPVVMATDNGDSAILDIERFDLEPKRPIFHGRITITEEESRNIDRARFIELANKIIDISLFTPRQLMSIQEIGKTLSGVPQLATAAHIAGAAVAYAVRQIALGNNLPSGRYIVGFDTML